MIESKNMNYKLSNKKSILIIGFPWPYSYGGHRTTKLCRELSKNYNVICLTRPLFRYLHKLNLEPFKVYQTKGPTTIYDSIRFTFSLLSKLRKKNSNQLFIDSGLVNKINEKNNFHPLVKLFIRYCLKIKFYFENFFAIPDDHWPWIISARSLTKYLCKKYKPFIIISSYPVSSHLIAAGIKNSNPEIKWIAEFPDLWSQNHIYPYMKIRQNIDQILEKNILKKSDKIITCQPGWAKILENMHNTKIEYIPHCTDLEMHNEKRNKITKNKIFVIRYLGTLYEQQIPYLKLFMNSFEQFIEHVGPNKIEEIKVSVEFIGTTSSDLENLIKKNKYSSYFKVLPKVSYEESLDLMHSAKLLFLPLYVHNNKLVNWFSSKIIEYIGSRNQCLIVGEQCEDFKLLINNYPLLNTEEKCLKILLKAFNNYSETENLLSIGNKIDIEQFSIKTLSKRFLNLKNNL